MLLFNYALGFCYFYFVNSFLNSNPYNKAIITTKLRNRFQISNFDNESSDYKSSDYKSSHYKSSDNKIKRNYEVIDIDGKSNIWANEPKTEIIKNINYFTPKNLAIFLFTFAFISFVLTYINSNIQILVDNL